MSRVLNIFSHQMIEEQINCKVEKIGHKPGFVSESSLSETASNLCSDNTNFVIECYLKTFEDFIEDLTKTTMNYQTLKR